MVYYFYITPFYFLVIIHINLTYALNLRKYIYLKICQFKGVIIYTFITFKMICISSIDAHSDAHFTTRCVFTGPAL